MSKTHASKRGEIGEQILETGIRKRGEGRGMVVRGGGGGGGGGA
jgi:hypothetical protein